MFTKNINICSASLWMQSEKKFNGSLINYIVVNVTNKYSWENINSWFYSLKQRTLPIWWIHQFVLFFFLCLRFLSCVDSLKFVAIVVVFSYVPSVGIRSSYVWQSLATVSVAYGPLTPGVGCGTLSYLTDSFVFEQDCTDRFAFDLDLQHVR